MAFRMAFSVGGKWFIWLFGGVWFVVGVPFLLGGVHLIQVEQRFANEAVTAQAKVLTRTVGEARSSNGGSSTRYRVTYRFTADDGQIITGNDVVDVDRWESLREQGPVEIQYLASDPAQHRLPGNADWTGTIIMTVVGSVFTLAGGGILAFAAFRALGTSRLVRHGLPAEATVTAVEQSNFSINGVTQWVIRYQYNDSRGRAREGKSGYLSPQEARIWEDGNKGMIRYDREHSDKSLWIGKG